MGAMTSCAYVGRVVHKRLTPKAHAFHYSVFSFALDVDEIDRLAGTLRLFSRNRWNLVSFHDRDHGSGDGTPVGEHIRKLLLSAGLESSGHRITLLCYPRLAGFVFNPLSVYFCARRDGRLGTIVYEVSNTVGERKSYVIPVAHDEGDPVAQECAKEMYVSPFTSPYGRYEFHVVRPGERVVVGVDLRSGGVPVLKTHFHGKRRSLSDWSLVRLVAQHPLMTFKVVAGIHFEALRLWLKGVPVVRHYASPAYSYTIVPASQPEALNVE